MKIKMNKKGFTLIELLAVIVVLALIMVLAVPSILTTMNSARKKSFQMYGEKILNAAMTLYESQQLLGESGSHTYTVNSVSKLCYTFEDMGISGAGSYKGFVVVNSSDAIVDNLNQTSYEVYLSDGSYAYNAASSDDVLNNINSIITKEEDVQKVDSIVAVDSNGISVNCKVK